MITRLQERVPDRKTATPAQIQTIQERLRLTLPALLQQIYLEVGVSGFGPGDDGLLPLPSALLPGRLYPLCGWGGGILSALDCLHPDAPIIRIDPNMAKADVAARVPEALHFDRAAEVKQACWVESPSLEKWLTDWLDGQPLFYAAYRGAEIEDDDEDFEDEDGEEAE